MKAVVFFLWLLASSNAMAIRDIPEVWKKNFAEVRVTGSYFNTTSNYEERGSIDDLPNNGSLTNYIFRPQIRYNFSPYTLSVFGGTNVSHVSATANSLTNENTQVTDVFLGATTTLHRSKTFIVLGEAEGALALAKFDPNTTDALTSDGVNYIFPRVLAKKVFKKLWIGAHLGLKLRAEGLSGLLTWSDRVGYDFGKIDASIGMSGFESVIRDNTNQVGRELVPIRVNAQSLLYHSYNPALMQVDASVDWKLTPRFATMAFITQSLDGEHYAAGMTVGLQIRYSFSLTSASSPKANKKTPEGSFEVETNETDADLFEPDTE